MYFQRLDFESKKCTLGQLESAQTTIFIALGRSSQITSVSNQGRFGVNFGIVFDSPTDNVPIFEKAPKCFIYKRLGTFGCPNNSLFELFRGPDFGSKKHLGTGKRLKSVDK